MAPPVKNLSLLRTHMDPVTGDALSNGEAVSWLVQGIIRRWLFLGVLTLLTAYVWIVADPIWHHPLTDVWNLWASYLAIFIEGVTAMALINQTRRDATVIREIRRLVRQTEEKIEADELRFSRMEEKLDALLVAQAHPTPE